MDREKIIELFKEADSFYLVAHILPDGDSIGSLLALGEALQNMGKEAKLFSPGKVPRKYAFLKGAGRIGGQIADGPGPDEVVVALDCSDLERLGEFGKLAGRGRHLVNIDHHVTNQYYGTLNLVEPAAATGEIIFHLLAEMKQPLTDSIAEALYVAVATDTGSFKFDNTTAATHRVAAKLLQYRVNPGELSQRIFDERPLSFYLLLKEALATLELHGGDRIAVMAISKVMLERCGTTVEEIEGIVNYTRNIEGVELGILFFVESPAEVKVGFRTRSVDVSLLAERLNGGGHAKAAGCRMHGSYEQVKEKVLREAETLLEQATARGEEPAWTGS